MLSRAARRGALLTVALGAAAAPAPSSALVILETATLGVSGQTTGTVASAGQFIGARFSVAERTEVTSIGAHLGALTLGASAFGAIVPSGPAPSLPTFLPTEIEAAALTSVVFSLTATAEMKSASTSAILEPGGYAVLFGSGYFGAAGAAFGAAQGVNFPFASYMFAVVGAETWLDGGVSGVRMLITGDPAPLPPPPETPGGGDQPPAPPAAAAVPPPPAALLLGSALIGAAEWRRRRRQASAATRFRPLALAR